MKGQTLCWVDIPVTDLERAMAFYAAVLAQPVTRAAASVKTTTANNHFFILCFLLDPGPSSWNLLAVQDMSLSFLTGFVKRALLTIHGVECRIA